MFDLQSILRALAMASGLQRGVMDPALFTIGRNRDRSLDHLETGEPIQGGRPEEALDRLMRESKEANARRDAETDAKLQAEVQATRAAQKPMQSPTVDRWREMQQTTTADAEAPAGVATSRKPRAIEDDLATIVEAQTQASRPEPQGDRKEPSALSTATDVLQTGLDAVGVVDPTPISDGINAVWSLGRAFTDPERRGEHLQNAAISAVSMVPYIGDTAKLLKTGRYAKTAARVANFNSGASTATKAAQRGELRDAVGGMLGGGSGNDSNDPVNAAGGSGGGSEPPRSRSLSPGGDDDERRGEMAAVGFFNKLEGAGESLLAFAGPLGKAVVATVGFVKGLELLNSGVIALNKELAPYNAQLSAAYAQYEVDEMGRNIDKGNAMAGPMKLLIQEQSELKDSLAKVSNPLNALVVGLEAKATEIINALIKASMVAEVSGSALEGIKTAVFAALRIIEPAAQGTVGQQFFRDVSDGKFDGREPAFGGVGRTRLHEFATEQDRKDIFGP